MINRALKVLEILIVVMALLFIAGNVVPAPLVDTEFLFLNQPLVTRLEVRAFWSCADHDTTWHEFAYVYATPADSIGWVQWNRFRLGDFPFNFGPTHGTLERGVYGRGMGSPWREPPNVENTVALFEPIIPGDYYVMACLTRGIPTRWVKDSPGELPAENDYTLAFAFVDGLAHVVEGENSIIICFTSTPVDPVRDRLRFSQPSP